MTASTLLNNVNVNQKIRRSGSVTVNGNEYHYFLIKVDSSISKRTETRVQFNFTSSRLKNGKMSMNIYEGFTFNNFSDQDYNNANVSDHFSYPHQLEFDKHKFQDAMIGDVLLTGMKQDDGTTVPDDSLKLSLNNLPSNLFSNYLKKPYIINVKGNVASNTLEYKNPNVNSYTLSKDGRNVEFSVNLTQPLEHGVYEYEFNIISNLSDGFDVSLYEECGADGYQGTSLY